MYFWCLGVCFQWLHLYCPICRDITAVKGGPGTQKPAGEKVIYVDMSVHCGGLLRCGEPGNCAETRVCVLLRT